MKLTEARRVATDGQTFDDARDRIDVRRESLVERLRRLLNRDVHPGHLGMAAAGLGDFDSWRDGHGRA